ncbi:MAG: hypothetical protein HQK87_07780, partial [Nitrospinae bacterium]|nr:hypothetical protein [Nitrospinota bacterium]
LQGKDLAALVGARSIHQFLQGLITRVQVFEASVVERGGDRLDLLMESAARHGRLVAGRLAPGENPPSIADIGRLLNDTQLEGMPCDPPATFTPLPSGEGFDYLHSTCNHMANWSFTGVDPAVMCRLNNRWIAGFVEGLGGSYGVTETLAEGGKGCKATVKRMG